MPMMTKKLKAADPTMVPGPRLPASKCSPKISMTESIISGAEDPRTIRLRLATVLFHTFTLMVLDPIKKIKLLHMLQKATPVFLIEKTV